MHQSLKKAFEIIFHKTPDSSMQEWEVARDVMTHFDGRILSEDLAKECIFQIVNHTMFPNQEITHDVVERAEHIAEELFEELSGVDPHMNVIAHLERKYYENKELEKNQENRMR